MKRVAVLVLALLLLIGCGEKTPLEVIEGTWEIHDKAATPSTMTFDTSNSISILRYLNVEEIMPFAIITQDKGSIILLVEVRPNIKSKGSIHIVDKDTLRFKEDGENEVLLKRITKAKQ